MHDLYVSATDHEVGANGAACPWQKGQTLVVVAVMLVVLIAFLGLVIDGGNVYAQRRQMQNAADAAALAGARALAVAGEGAVEAAANEFAALNGATSCSVTKTATTVEAVVSKTVETYFVRIVRVDNIAVGARAKAKISPPKDVSCLVLPITVDYNALMSEPRNPGDTFTIWESDPDPKKCSGIPGPRDIRSEMRGWLNLEPDQDCHGAAGASEVKCWVCAGAKKKDCPRYPIRVGDWVVAEPGLANSALSEMKKCDIDKTALIPLYDEMCECNLQKPTNTPKPKETPTPGPSPTLAPTVEACEEIRVGGVPLSCTGCSAYYHIRGFASVTIRAITDTKDCKAIDVEWQTLTNSSDCSEGGGSDETNAWQVYLVE